MPGNDEETLARVFLEANAITGAAADEILETARVLAARKRIPLSEAVVAIELGVHGHAKRLQDLGFERLPGDPARVLDHVQRKVRGRRKDQGG